MVLENLDRTQWTFDQALAHVERAVVAVRERQAPEPAPRPADSTPPWLAPKDPREAWKAEAHEQLLVALRDGDLHAQGRFSDTRNDRNWGPDYGKTWILHSGNHAPISPAQWREGRFVRGALTALNWEFIDIRIPRFMVLAIWPEPAASPDGKPGAYTTPYLDLMQAAIVEFGLTETRQGKKEAIVDWLLTRAIDGEPLSRNLAEAMATLIRLPAAQRGGAKRVFGDPSRAS
ncbi:MAG: hypothetical protein ACQEUZ_04840 [Pseudomonadota bacterium]